MFAATLLGLLSAVFYGATDFAAAIASRRGGVLRTLALGQGAAALLLTLALIASGAPPAPPAVWALLMATNVVNLAGTAVLFRGMALGRLTLVAPLAAAYGGVGAILSAITGEALPPMRWAGLALLCAGAMLAAKPPPAAAAAVPGEASAAVAAAHALAAALLYGVGFWVQGHRIVPVLGIIVPAWSYYASGAVVAAILLAFRPSAPDPISPKISRRIACAAVATGLLGAAGYLTLSAGQATGAVAVVTALSSLASGVTVLLARMFLGERAGAAGAAGIALILGGLALIQM